jgi:hypothetical protein
VPACVKDIANYGWYEHPFGNQRCGDRQKTIIASGYTKTKEVDLAQELGAGEYIKKPYTL